MSEYRRVVVTGIGAVTPLGNNAAETWEGMKKGKNGIGPITLFDTENFRAKLAAEVRNFDPREYLEVNEVLRTDRYAQFAVAAAKQAADDSGVEGTVEPERFAVIFGTGIGGISTFEKEHSTLLEKGPRRVSPLMVPMMIGNMAAGMIAIRHDCRGSVMPAVTACASGSNAIGEAMHLIRHGYADAAITGGAEAAIIPSAIAGFANMKALSVSENPEEASLPFDRRRNGFVMGEGAAALILEEYEHAKARGAVIYGEVCGYVPYHGAASGRTRRRPGHDRRDEGSGVYAGGRGVYQRARYRDADERCAGDPGDQKGAGRGERTESLCQFHQIHDRSYAGRGRRGGSPGLPLCAEGRRYSAHHQPEGTGRSLRPELCAGAGGPCRRDAGAVQFPGLRRS